MTNKLFKMGVLSLASVAVLAACSDGTTTETETTTSQATEETTTSAQTDDSSSEETSSQAAESSATDGASDASGSFAVSMEQAVDIFLGEYPDAQIEEVDFDDDFGEFEYQISGFDGTNEYELDINAETGDIQETETDNDDDGDNQAIDFASIITESEAIEIARGELGQDVTIEGWVLDADDGRTVYEVETNQDDDITVDAETSEILEIDQDD